MSYVGLDYPGWEQVNFNTMSWRYVQPGIEVDERQVKRVSATKWLITDDHSEWVGYADVYLVADRANIIELIELYYQDYLKELA